MLALQFVACDRVSPSRARGDSRVVSRREGAKHVWTCAGEGSSFAPAGRDTARIARAAAARVCRVAEMNRNVVTADRRHRNVGLT